MKSVVPAIAAGFLAITCLLPSAARAADPIAERYKEAMQSARWTGPMLASTAETLPRGHFYTEPYFFDVVSGGESHPGSSGFYQYGLADNFTVGFQPSLSLESHGSRRGVIFGDVNLLSQLRLTHFTAERRIPSVSLVFFLSLPTGRYDRLNVGEVGHGSGSLEPQLGVNVQQYFLLKNGRLLRGRINVLKSFPQRAQVIDRSVYGTVEGFRGHAKPGSKTSVIGAVEYSVTREWVIALDVIHDSRTKTRVYGRDRGGSALEQVFPSSRDIGFAPAVEYNWSDSTGVLFGVWISPKGHNSAASVTPAIAISRFW